MTLVEINKAINAADVADRGSTALFEFLRKLQSVQDRIDIGLTGGTVGILNLKVSLLETMIDIAENDLHIPIRKKSGSQPSKEKHTKKK